MLNKQEVQDVLDLIRPSLQADGGDIEFVDITDDDKVLLRLTGVCAGCPMSHITLKNGVERILKDRIPQVQEVVDVDMA